MASVTYRIGGKYDNSAMNQAKKGLQDFQKAVNAFTGAAVVTALVTVTKKALECESAFLEANKAVQRIDFAASLNPNLQKTSRQLQNFAKDVSDKLRGAVSVDELNAEIAKLSFDKTGEQIEKIIPAATDLSAALGISLSEAVTQLNNTFAGTTGTLGKMFPEIKNLSKESLAAGGAIDIIAEKTKGMGEVMAQSGTGSVLAYKNAVDNMKETIGRATTNFFTPMRDLITRQMNKWIDAKNAAMDYKQAVSDLKNGKATIQTYQILLDDAVSRKARLKKEYEGSDQWPAVRESIDREIKKYSNVITQLTIEEEKKKKSTQTSTAVVTEQTAAVEKVTEVVKETTPAWVKNKKAMEEYMQQQQEANDEVIEMQIRALRYREAELRAIEEETRARRKAAIDAVTGAVMGGTGDIGSLVNSGVSGGIWGILATLIGKALSELEAISENVKWLNGSIGELFRSVFSADSDFMRAVDRLIQPFRDGFETMKGIVSAIFDVIGEVLNLIGDSFANFTNVLNAVGPAIISILNSVQTVLQIINNLVDFLEPVSNLVLLFIKGIATVVTVIANVIGNILTAIYNAVISVYNFFAGKKNQKEKKDYTAIDSGLTAIWNTPASVAPATAVASATYSSGSASYTAARDIYVTVNYVQSYVNGDAREIALSIRDEIRSAERLGY